MKGLQLLRSTRQFPHLRPITSISLKSPIYARQMLSTKTRRSIPHEERTAAEPRQNRLYTVRLSNIEQISPSVRLLYLTIPRHESEGEADAEDEEPQSQQPLTFLPGQWLDVHIPSVSKAGGFSITSTPADARILPSPEPRADLSGEEPDTAVIDPRGRSPYLELAVQEAPGNPAGAWLWKPAEEILGRDLSIRVGGSFVWPPSGVEVREIKTVVLIAGGVGINPLISILSHLNNHDPSTPNPTTPTLHINILYTARLPSSNSTALDQILFLSRLREIIRSQSHSQSPRLRISLEIFLTNLADDSSLVASPPDGLTIHSRRIKRQDLQAAVIGEDGEVNPVETVCYVCGPPAMTDEFVDVLRGLLGGEKDRVMFEKWW